ncbi:DUF3575 domain-containing protein [Flavobacterium ardleyense]|uniref:DUF3575 domain-containing protein n=1 Tax=Flavobacterium ardleyense TaxID=2038737 RepID=A0ABW5Z4H9_9FLAO
MKSILVAVVVLLSSFIYSQDRINVNATTLVGFPSIGYEKMVAPNFSFHIDATGSIFNSFNDMPLKFLMITPEMRWYSKKENTGLYVGGHIGGVVFNLQKYGYENSDKYQKGLGYQLGVSVGYIYPVSDRIAIEAFVGGGSVQTFYKGYVKTTGIRYDGAKEYNKSGEWLPYRGGVTIIFIL